MIPCFFKLRFFKISVFFVLSPSMLTLNEEQVSSILELSSAVKAEENKLGHKIDIANPNTIKNDNIFKKIQNINNLFQQSLNSRVVENSDQPHTNQIKQGEYQKTNSKNGSTDEIKIVDIKRGGIEGGAIIEKGGVKYILKGFHKKDGKYLYKPNARNKIHAFFTRDGLDGINNSTIEEYVSLKLANAIFPGISPETNLCKIENKDNTYQYCLMTEISGQGKGEKFQILEKFFEENPSTYKTKLNKDTENRPIPSKEFWQNAFALSVCLLNDGDVNKLDNIGIVSGGTEGSKLSLFDLGHPTPDKFQLDPKTLLPESPNILDKILLWVINLFVTSYGLPWTFKMNDKILEQLGGPEDRAKTIRNLLDRKESVLSKLDEIKNEFQDTADKKQIEEFKSKIEKRFAQLKNVLNEYEKINEKQSIEIEMVDLSHKQV